MAHVKADRVQETTTGTGTGALTLLGAVSKFRAFSAVLANADTCVCLIEHSSAAQYEVSLCTFGSGGNTLTRSTVYASSSGGALVNFSAGTKTVSLVGAASKAVIEDPSGNVSITGNLSANGYLQVVGSDATPILRLIGASKGLRGIPSSTDFSLQAVDQTLVSGFEPLSLVGSEVRIGASGEIARFLSTGLGIGTPTPASRVHIRGLGSSAGSVSTSSDLGATLVIQDTGALTGNGGQIVFGAAQGTFAAIKSMIGSGSDNTAGALSIQTRRVTSDATLTEAMRFLSGGGIEPGTDNNQAFGGSGKRWSVFYAGTGTINTSGADAKLFIGEASDAEKRAAVKIRANPRRYKFADAVEAKGEAAARWHFGYIAEDVRDALAAEGLDPWAYAFLCSDPIMVTETYTETATRPKIARVPIEVRDIEIVNGQPVLVTRTVEVDQPAGQLMDVRDEAGQLIVVPTGANDAEGNPISAPLRHFVPEMEEYVVERTREVDSGEVRLGLRYSELEAFLRCAD